MEAWEILLRVIGAYEVVAILLIAVHTARSKYKLDGLWQGLVVSQAALIISLFFVGCIAAFIWLISPFW